MWGMWLICEVSALVNEQSLMIKRECMCDHKRLWSCAFVRDEKGTWTTANIEWEIVSIEWRSVSVNVYIYVMTMSVYVCVASMNMDVSIVSMRDLGSLWVSTREHEWSRRFANDCEEAWKFWLWMIMNIKWTWVVANDCDCQTNINDYEQLWTSMNDCEH